MSSHLQCRGTIDKTPIDYPNFAQSTNTIHVFVTPSKYFYTPAADSTPAAFHQKPFQVVPIKPKTC
jgi:hypothetical protein